MDPIWVTFSSGLMLAGCGIPALGLVPLGLWSEVREKQPPWFRCSPKGMLIWFPWEEGVLHLSKMKCLEG